MLFIYKLKASVGDGYVTVIIEAGSEEGANHRLSQLRISDEHNSVNNDRRIDRIIRVDHHSVLLKNGSVFDAIRGGLNHPMQRITEVEIVSA
jgi:hypothetical protein